MGSSCPASLPTCHPNPDIMQLACSSSVRLTGPRPFSATPSRHGRSRAPCPRIYAEDGAAAKKVAEKKPESKKPFSPPTLDPDTPSPTFGGSTGGLLRKAQVEEFHVITWNSKKEQVFEMPTAGAAIMREGPNLLKLSRKEQCLALLTQLRTKFKIDGAIYRVFPNGETQYLHPKDGVYPEKVNPGRKEVNAVFRRIGSNTNPAKVKFTGKPTYEVEA
ncbi:PSAD1 [Auxenochlorella protothecoides x Auxenochlorella symbiontica]